MGIDDRRGGMEELETWFPSSLWIEVLLAMCAHHRVVGGRVDFYFAWKSYPIMRILRYSKPKKEMDKIKVSPREKKHVRSSWLRTSNGIKKREKVCITSYSLRIICHSSGNTKLLKNSNIIITIFYTILWSIYGINKNFAVSFFTMNRSCMVLRAIVFRDRNFYFSKCDLM